MVNYDIENELRETLTSNEKLLWTGRPKTGLILRAIEFFLIPFSLLWFGFAIFWEYNALRMGNTFFALFGVPFIVMGLYISIGRFVVDILKRKHTRYGITDNRVIIKSGIFNKSIQSFNIKTLSDITMKERSDGSGTISMGPFNNNNNDNRNGNGFFFRILNDGPSLKSQSGLELIEEVKKVYTILIDQQRK
jgi:hypothetical protein